MPTNYAESYEHLKEAQARMDGLQQAEGRQERYAALRVAFFHLYEAANVACICCEASGFPGTAAGARAELSDFLQASRTCHRLVDAPNEELRKSCERWVSRAKAYVERIRAMEARMTNLQYARIPEPQNGATARRDGRTWKGGDSGRAV